MNTKVANALNKDVLQLHNDLVMFYNDNLQDISKDAEMETLENTEMDCHDVKKDYQLLLPVLNAWVGNGNLINLSKTDFNRRNIDKALKKVEKFNLIH